MANSYALNNLNIGAIPSSSGIGTFTPMQAGQIGTPANPFIATDNTAEIMGTNIPSWIIPAVIVAVVVGILYAIFGKNTNT